LKASQALERGNTMNRFKGLLGVAVAVVLLAGSVAPALAGPPPWAGPRPEETIVDLASGNPDFSILVAALTETGLAGALDGKGQFTVFAPTNAAFAALADELGLSVGDLVDFLLDNPEYLQDVLLYHVAPGRRNSNAVLGSKQINTLYGEFLYQDGGVLTDQVGREVNLVGSAIDIQASNGTIHVIDNVLLPYLP
jgi:uncharacterized surface protein with fasciclin (FAS1) repeats